MDDDLRELVEAIVAGDSSHVSRLLAESSALARMSFAAGATRKTEKPYYFAEIGKYIYAGDTALHFAAAAYRCEIARKLLAAGASVHARNRFGDEALHAAAVGAPGSPTWNPVAQVATITCLIDAGADPNARTKAGVTPLHRAVRTRCAAAVRALLQRRADPAIKNKNGSTPMNLAVHNTGRGGTGLPEAKAQQQEILRLLQAGVTRTPEF
jgi:ankyrin repeat protein